MDSKKVEDMLKYLAYYKDWTFTHRLTDEDVKSSKLYEEILMAEEGLTSTKHDKIFISKPTEISYNDVRASLKELSQIEYNKNYSIKRVKDTMKKVVPTYHEFIMEAKNGKNK